MRAFFRQRRQVLDAVVIKRRQTRSSPSRFPIVALAKPVRIKVVFNHGQAYSSRRTNGLLNLLTPLLAAGFPVEPPRKPGEHHVAKRETPGLHFMYKRSE